MVVRVVDCSSFIYPFSIEEVQYLFEKVAKKSDLQGNEDQETESDSESSDSIVVLSQVICEVTMRAMRHDEDV